MGQDDIPKALLRSVCRIAAVLHLFYGDDIRLRTDGAHSDRNRRSGLERHLARHLAYGGNCADFCGDHTFQESARKATQQKKIYGYLVIPPNFESDVLAGRQATLSYYYHYALLSVGSEVRGAFETVLQPLSMGPIVSEATALGVSESTVTNFLVPVNVQSHPLYNPDLDYSVYLSHPFFFILFQVLILLVTVYALGSEIKFRTGDAWLESADGNIFTAVVAKLLPYTVIFIVMAIFANYVMFGVLHIPFSCGFWPLNLTARRTVRDSHASAGCLHLLDFPGDQHHHQYRFDGGIARSHAFRSDLPGPVHVPGRLLCLVPLSGAPFRRNQPEPAVRGLRLCVYLAKRGRAVPVHSGGTAAVTAP